MGSHQWVVVKLRKKKYIFVSSFVVWVRGHYPCFHPIISTNDPLVTVAVDTGTSYIFYSYLNSWSHRVTDLGDETDRIK